MSYIINIEITKKLQKVQTNIQYINICNRATLADH